MNSFRRLVSSALSKTTASKFVPAATGAAVFGMGCVMIHPYSTKRMLSSGKAAGLVPHSLDAKTNHKTERAGAARSIEHDVGLDFAAYGAQFAKLIMKEENELRDFWEEHSKNASPDLELEVKRRLLRLRSLNAAFWALHMVDFANCPEVHEILSWSAGEINMSRIEIMRILETAQGAIVSGEIDTLKDAIQKLFVQHQQRGLLPKRPASELERFMGDVPNGSGVLTRLQLLQQIAAQNTEASRLLLDDTMYQLWWVLEHQIRQFSRN